MARIFPSAEALIGGTPLVEIPHIARERNLKARVLVKLEGQNPGGSAKDRVALSMVEDAEKRGLLAPGSTIIEPTSGNTGIGLCVIAAARGYKCVIVMPDSMSAERQQLMRALGANVVLTPGAKGMQGAIEEAERLHKATPGSFIPAQFDNPANPDAHYKTTGPEIFADTDGEVDIFVAGVGTGGTLTGAGRYLKEHKPSVRLIAVEPASSPLLSKGYAGTHGLQGIGANFVPTVLDRTLIDELFPVTEDEAYAAGRLLAAREGILAGISSGAALHAALVLAGKEENAGKTIVALLPDLGDRYLSTPIYQ